MKLNPEDRKVVGKDIQKVEFGWPIGMRYGRPPGQGFHEIRSNLSEKRIARVIFFIKSSKMVLLHSIVKKTRKRPGPDLDLAVKRIKEVENHD